MTFPINIVIVNTMTYKIDQKIGKNVYVYEVESYWDKQKKQARQKRKYIGKKDTKTGEISTPRKGFTPRMARDYGHIYLLLNLANRIGLYQVLKESFGQLWQEMLYLCLYQVLEAKPLYLFKPWSEATYLKYPLVLSSKDISRIVFQIGKRDDLIEKFYRLWIKRHKDTHTIIFDITSLSSYSKLISNLERGYNRDGEKLYQVNLGLILGQPSGIPLAYRIYPGSITDVTTLRNLILFLGDLGMSDFTFILDRGFYSGVNIKDMDSQKIKFIMPLSFSTKIARQLISKYHTEITSPLGGFYYGARPMFYLKKDIRVGNVSLYAHLFFDERRKADEMDCLMRQIVEIEDKTSKKSFYKKEEVRSYIESAFKGSTKLFDIVSGPSSFKLERKPKTISRLMNKMGKTIIITNDYSLEREEILNLYRSKDVLEKMFDIVKNELKTNRLRVSSKESMEGRIFLTYLSLILYCQVTRIMKEKDLFKKYSISEVFFELKKLRAVSLTNEKSYLTEVTKRQRNIFKQFEVQVPVGT